MIKPLENIKKTYPVLKAFVVGFLLGAVVVSLVLDNRIGAVMKAFNNPVAVNGASFESEIVIKK